MAKTSPLLAATVVLACASALRTEAASPEYTDVFIGDKMPEKAAKPEGYNTFRIPAIITAANGDLLAFCEGRRDSAADNGKIDIVMKRSTDGGATWGPLQFVYGKPDAGTTKYTIGNPVPIVDRTTGAILLLFCENNRTGLNITRSFDHGATWTPPANINLIGNVPPHGSTTVPAVNYAALTKATGNDVQNFATGPGHGLQLANGRFVVPMWFSSSTAGTPVWTGPKIDQALLDAEGLTIPRNPSTRFFSGLLVSDDGGNSWKIGALSAEGSNESTAAQLPDGTLVMSSRFEAGNYRVISRSSDGGNSFSSVTLDLDLIDIGCQGSLLVWPGPGGRNHLAHSNAAVKGLNANARANVTLRLSTDGGTTWSESRVIDRGKSAYSDVVSLNDGNLGILYEQGVTDYRDRITFVRTTFEWLLCGPTYNSWVSSLGVTGLSALPDAQAFGDGIANGIRYALGLDKLSSPTTGLPAIQFVSENGANYLGLALSPDPTRPAALTVEASSDLIHWDATAVLASLGPPQLYRDVVPFDSNAPKRFLRVRANADQ